MGLQLTCLNKNRKAVLLALQDGGIMDCRTISEKVGFYAAPCLRTLVGYGLIEKVDRNGYDGRYRYRTRVTLDPESLK